MLRLPGLGLTGALALLGALGTAATAAAQLPGLPVLQNGFANAGITAGVNYGTAEDVRGYAAAAAWAPSNARFQVSAGIGGYDPPGDGSTFLAYGGRVAVPLTGLTGNGRLGVAPFVGIGGGNRDSVGVLQVPAGVAAGYRFAIGATRGMSVHLSSFYCWNRVTVDDVAESGGLVRISGGLDVAITPALGLSLGYETGAEADAAAGEPGPVAPLFGIGLSYAFGR